MTKSFLIFYNLWCSLVFGVGCWVTGQCKRGKVRLSTTVRVTRDTLLIRTWISRDSGNEFEEMSLPSLKIYKINQDPPVSQLVVSERISAGLPEKIDMRQTIEHLGLGMILAGIVNTLFTIHSISVYQSFNKPFLSVKLHFYSITVQVILHDALLVTIHYERGRNSRTHVMAGTMN